MVAIPCLHRYSTWCIYFFIIQLGSVYSQRSLVKHDQGFRTTAFISLSSLGKPISDHSYYTGLSGYRYNVNTVTGYNAHDYHQKSESTHVKYSDSQGIEVFDDVVSKPESHADLVYDDWHNDDLLTSIQKLSIGQILLAMCIGTSSGVALGIWLQWYLGSLEGETVSDSKSKPQSNGPAFGTTVSSTVKQGPKEKSASDSKSKSTTTKSGTVSTTLLETSGKTDEFSTSWLRESAGFWMKGTV